MSGFEFVDREAFLPAPPVGPEGVALSTRGTSGDVASSPVRGESMTPVARVGASAPSPGSLVPADQQGEPALSFQPRRLPRPRYTTKFCRICNARERMHRDSECMVCRDFGGVR